MTETKRAALSLAAILMLGVVALAYAIYFRGVNGRHVYGTEFDALEARVKALEDKAAGK